MTDVGGSFKVTPGLKQYWRFIWITMVALSALMLAGCGDDSNTDTTAIEGPTPEVEATEAVAAPEQIDFSQDSTSHIYIGTGSVQGVYFPIGGVICRLVNRQRADHNIRCTLESTGGSINNLNELRDGNFDLVVAQSDWHYHALNGSSTFDKVGADQALRSVFALEADPLALIVRVDSDIQVFDDLEDRIVSLGYSRSLQHRILDDYLAIKGWTEERFQQVVLMSDAKQGAALCDGQVEAILLLSSAMNDALSELPKDCALRLIALDDASVDEVIAQHPFYRRGDIPASMALASEQDIPSFGLGATFVASESTSPKAIYYVVKAIVENFRDFKSLHPSLQMIKLDELPTAALTAPLHPGAIRYYREARLLK